MSDLKAPFPYFGGKSKVVEEVWLRFGEVKSYVEPFCGSMAMLLGGPRDISYEHVNDIDGLLINFWRAIQQDPEGVAKLAETPSSTVEMAARNNWLYRSKDKISKMVEDPKYYDVEAAAYWVYVRGSMIGGRGLASENISLRLPQLGRPRGIHAGSRRARLQEVFKKLSDRLRKVVICCTDWQKILSPSIFHNSPIAIFMDPPYQEGNYDDDVYENSDTVFSEVRKWCLENGDDPDLRIALCGYEGNEMPDTWKEWAWKTSGGFGRIGKEKTRGIENKTRERIWFSPHCHDPTNIEDGFLGNFMENEERSQ